MYITEVVRRLPPLRRLSILNTLASVQAVYAVYSGRKQLFDRFQKYYFKTEEDIHEKKIAELFSIYISEFAN